VSPTGRRFSANYAKPRSQSNSWCVHKFSPYILRALVRQQGLRQRRQLTSITQLSGSVLRRCSRMCYTCQREVVLTRWIARWTRNRDPTLTPPSFAIPRVKTILRGNACGLRDERDSREARLYAGAMQSGDSFVSSSIGQVLHSAELAVAIHKAISSRARQKPLGKLS